MTDITELKRRLNDRAQDVAEHLLPRGILDAKDLNECRKAGIGWQEIRRCFEAARSLDPPKLMRPGSFADAVVDLFWPRNGTESGYRMPFSKVCDRVIFRPAELIDWTGATGAGKSQVMSYVLAGIAEQAARVCIASLEMPPAQLLRRLVKQAGNVDRRSS